MDALSLVQLCCLQDPQVVPTIVAERHGLAEEVFLKDFVLLQIGPTVT